MIEILLGIIAIIGLAIVWLLVRGVNICQNILAHLKGIDDKTITAVADVGSSLSRSDEIEWQIEQDKLKETGTQIFS